MLACYNRTMRIEARNVSAAYGKKVVLHSVSLTVEARELVGLIGPNGSGKSTLLRVISGTLPVLQGEILLDDEPVPRMSAREIALKLAFVPQSEPRLFEFSVRDVVLMGRHAYAGRTRAAVNEDYAAATRAMAATDTIHLADRAITTLSGGEHRRVLIARAFAQDTPTYLLDEPTAHLDIGHQSDLLTICRRKVNVDGASVLAALHDLNLAAEFCDRIILLNEGRIVAEGAPDAALTVETLTGIYGSGVVVTKRPGSGTPLVLAASAPAPSHHEDTLRIHVICGGGTGAILAGLHRHGFWVTSGVLNRLDSDEEACAALGIECVTEAPFSAITKEARSACEAMMASADAIVITDVPIGHGNIANLEMALVVLRRGKPVYLSGDLPIGQRDFTSGSASRIWRELIEAGAVIVNGLHELEPYLTAPDKSTDEIDRIAGPINQIPTLS